MMIKNIIAGVLVLAAAACSQAPSDRPDAFDALLNEHWDNVLAEQVFFRRDPDVFRMNGHLPNFSQDARDRRQAFNEVILSRLATIDEKTLSKRNQVNYKLILQLNLALLLLEKYNL